MPIPQTTFSNNIATAYPGMLADSGFHDIRTFAQAESSAEIPFGCGVVRNGTDRQAILPVDVNSKLVGVLVHSHDYAPNYELGATGVKPKNPLSILNRGRIWVRVEEAVVCDDLAWCRHTANGGNTQKGSWRKTTDSANAFSCKGLRYVTTQSTPGGLAILEVDMPAYFGLFGL